MAHISRELRDAIERSPVGHVTLMNGQELGFAVVLLAKQFIKQHPGKLEVVIGALENAKQMVVRQHVTPSEIQAEFDNGEIKIP
jgi:hypothetical protein